MQESPVKRKILGKLLVINTNHCKTEIDTLQYVIDKNGYKETTVASEGTVLWYGAALRDHGKLLSLIGIDIDIIRIRRCYYNRYPLMDVILLVLKHIDSILQRKTSCALFSLDFRGSSLSNTRSLQFPSCCPRRLTTWKTTWLLTRTT